MDKIVYARNTESRHTCNRKVEITREDTQGSFGDDMSIIRNTYLLRIFGRVII